MKLVILGPGALGCSLARHAASCGIAVRLVGKDANHAHKAIKGMEARGIETRGIEAWTFAALTFQDADAVLEALPEHPEPKIQAWRTISAWLPPNTLRLTGSSSLPVGALDLAAGLGGRLMAFHLFLPVGRMRIVELIAPETVSNVDRAGAAGLASKLGQKIVEVIDGPGYAAARMGLVQGLEAMRLLEDGIATAEDLDALMVHGYGHPVGPLELSDRIGLDLRLTIAERLFEKTGDSRFAPPRILLQKVAAGCLGRKTGAGFFTWGKDGKPS